MTNLKYGNTLIMNIRDWPLWEDALPSLRSMHNNLTSKNLQVYGEGNIWIIYWAMWSNRTHLEPIEIWWLLIYLCWLTSVSFCVSWFHKLDLLLWFREFCCGVMGSQLKLSNITPQRHWWPIKVSVKNVSTDVVVRLVTVVKG